MTAITVQTCLFRSCKKQEKQAPVVNKKRDFLTLTSSSTVVLMDEAEDNAVICAELA
jgi:hypothetical protein